MEIPREFLKDLRILTEAALATMTSDEITALIAKLRDLDDRLKKRLEASAWSCAKCGYVGASGPMHYGQTYCAHNATHDSEDE